MQWNVNLYVCYTYMLDFAKLFMCMSGFFSGTMAIPPAYADLGKSAKDIFNKGYGKSRNSPNM